MGHDRWRCIAAIIGAVIIVSPNLVLATPSLGTVGTLAEVAQQQGAGRFEVLDARGTQTVDPINNYTVYQDNVFSSVSVQDSGQTIPGPAGSAVLDITALADGQSSASLITGQLRLRSASTLVAVSPFQTSFSGLSSTASESDILTINGLLPHPVLIRVSMHVTGDITGAPNFFDISTFTKPTDPEPSFVNFGLSAGTFYGSVDNQVGIGSYNNDRVTYSQPGRTTASGGVIYGNTNFFDAAGRAESHFLDFTLYDDFMVSDQYRNVSLFATGTLNQHPVGAGSIGSDFSHTANIQITLPEGLTFSSASGVFLTQPQDETTNVSEPSSFSLFSLGICLTALTCLRGRFTQAAS